MINPAFSRFHPRWVSSWLIISFCVFGQLIHPSCRASNCFASLSTLRQSRLNVVYTCTDDIEADGQILAYEIHPDESLTEIGRVDAGKKTTAHKPPAEYDHLVIEIANCFLRLPRTLAPDARRNVYVLPDHRLRATPPDRRQLLVLISSAQNSLGSFAPPDVRDALKR